MDTFPLSVQTTYQDLLEAHRQQAVSNLGGTPVLKEKSGRKYWYVRKRLGNRIVERYLGPQSAELDQRIEAGRDAATDHAVFEKRCASMVAQLRAAGLPALDRQTGKVLRAMAVAGAFRLGGTLIGTHAFRLYSAELGVRFPPELGLTADVDVAAFENLKLAIDDKPDPSLARTFADLGLHPVSEAGDSRKHTRWRMPGDGLMVEFLVPRMQSHQDVVSLAPLGVDARALSYLNYLIAEPVQAVGLYRSGVLIQVPRVERYAIHKLIVASQRRKESAAKARKDLAQADLLIRILEEDRPEELGLAYEDACARGAKWRSAMDASLDRLPEARARLTFC
ncbi:hypothetical protein X907_2889 [Glycocaulis alkaliphilus]|uniref:Uncharacterized protein n=1 Tax=Glycocaulis alkaliphilus TaxID=1434191 RepID=A0A3T0EDL1_9PROT|nr:GSU2403 family nucleotidyltransferase fold protein [Glycocaulis alkaliphilus]AZU05395.1 hypothetical protein X907_2889 [Glycocaulis alkaliphilus]